MRKKAVLLTSFAIFAPITLVILLLVTLTQLHSSSNKHILLATSTVPKYQALPQSRSSLEQSISSQDGRIDVLNEFFEKHNSPLKDHSDTIVRISDMYELDYKLLPAIAMQESNLCKKIPKNSHNCWGFGIYGNQVLRYDNYPQAIEAVAKTLKNEYLSIGLKNPEEIMTKYTPSSNGSWAESVNFFMSHIQNSL